MRTRRTRRKPVSRRKREERRRTARRRAMIALGVLLLAGLAMAPQARDTLTKSVLRGMKTVQAMALPRGAQTEITLPQTAVYALQLGAYDSGERAKSEQTRLTQAGTPCVIWQRAQMRLVCDAAQSRGKLDETVAGSNDVWVIQDELPEVVLRVDAQAEDMEAVRNLLMLPDALFARLCAQEEISGLIAAAREAATDAQDDHLDNALYTQLAQSLVNWCALMEDVRVSRGDQAARSYARVTAYTLCYELRQALIAQSTASAQRTPSTAAEVMPPA